MFVGKQAVCMLCTVHVKRQSLLQPQPDCFLEPCGRTLIKPKLCVKRSSIPEIKLPELHAAISMYWRGSDSGVVLLLVSPLSV
jgi:hypothetical protein